MKPGEWEDVDIQSGRVGSSRKRCSCAADTGGFSGCAVSELAGPRGGRGEDWRRECGSLEESLGPHVEGAVETEPRGMATFGGQRESWSPMGGLESLKCGVEPDGGPRGGSRGTGGRY